MGELNLQVAASLDDAYQQEDVHTTWPTVDPVICYSATVSRMWGGHRFVPPNAIPQESTIIAAYIELYVYDATWDDINANIHFEKVAAPAQFEAVDDNITSRARTDASTSWIANILGTGWKTSPSLVIPLQELVDVYEITALVVIFRPNSDVTKTCKSRAFDYDPDLAAKLYIEYAGAQQEITPTGLAQEIAFGEPKITAQQHQRFVTLSGSLVGMTGKRIKVNSTEDGFEYSD